MKEFMLEGNADGCRHVEAFAGVCLAYWFQMLSPHNLEEWRKEVFLSYSFTCFGRSSSKESVCVWKPTWKAAGPKAVHQVHQQVHTANSHHHALHYTHQEVKQLICSALLCQRTKASMLIDHRGHKKRRAWKSDDNRRTWGGLRSN